MCIVVRIIKEYIDIKKKNLHILKSLVYDDREFYAIVYFVMGINWLKPSSFR